MLVENCGVELRYLVLAILVLDLALHALRRPELVLIFVSIWSVLRIYSDHFLSSVVGCVGS